MATLIRLYKETLQQLARVLAATAEEADAATEHISAMLIKIRDHHVDESPRTWKKLVLDLKVPYKLASTYRQALTPRQQRLQPAAAGAAAAALHTFFIRLTQERCDTVPDIVAEATLQQLQASQLLQQLPPMLTRTAQLLAQESRDLRSAAAADSTNSSSSPATHQRGSSSSSAAVAAAHRRVHAVQTCADALLTLFAATYQFCHSEEDETVMAAVMGNASGVLQLCVAALRSV